MFLYLPHGHAAGLLPRGVERHIEDRYGQNQQARCASLTAYGALKRLYRQYVRNPRTPLPDIAYTSDGKPYFVDPQAAHLSFSLSHTKGISVAALSDQGRVGVDAEYLSHERHGLHMRLAHSRFFAEEQLHLADNFHMQTRQILTLWTKKEALAKALQMPLVQICTAAYAGDLHVQSGSLTADTVFSLVFE